MDESGSNRIDEVESLQEENVTSTEDYWEVPHRHVAVDSRSAPEDVFRLLDGRLERRLAVAGEGTVHWLRTGDCVQRHRPATLVAASPPDDVFRLDHLSRGRKHTACLSRQAAQ